MSAQSRLFPIPQWMVVSSTGGRYLFDTPEHAQAFIGAATDMLVIPVEIRERQMPEAALARRHSRTLGRKLRP